MNVKALEKFIEEDIDTLVRDFYPSSGDAFAHFAIREFFDLEDEDAYEFAAIGGADDKGIDGFWDDPNERRLILVQAKYSKDSKSFDRSVVLEAVG